MSTLCESLAQDALKLAQKAQALLRGDVEVNVREDKAEIKIKSLSLKLALLLLKRKVEKKRKIYCPFCILDNEEDIESLGFPVTKKMKDKLYALRQLVYWLGEYYAFKNGQLITTCETFNKHITLTL